MARGPFRARADCVTICVRRFNLTDTIEENPCWSIYNIETAKIFILPDTPRRCYNCDEANYFEKGAAGGVKWGLSNWVSSKFLGDQETAFSDTRGQIRIEANRAC